MRDNTHSGGILSIARITLPRNLLDVRFLKNRLVSLLREYVRSAYPHANYLYFPPRFDPSPWFVGVLPVPPPFSSPLPDIFGTGNTDNDFSVACR